MPQPRATVLPARGPAAGGPKGKAPTRQEGWRTASGGGWARMPGQVTTAGQASSQAAPSFPSQLATKFGQSTPCPGRQEKKTLPRDEATGRLDWKRSDANSTTCSYKWGAPSLAQASPKRKTAARTPPAALHTRAAQDQARGTCVFKASRAKKSPGPAISCPALTSPFCPGNTGSRKIILLYLYT